MSEPFTLRRDPKPVKQKFAQEKLRQPALFCGLMDSPGQENLFQTDGPPPVDEELKPEQTASGFQSPR